MKLALSLVLRANRRGWKLASAWAATLAVAALPTARAEDATAVATPVAAATSVADDAAAPAERLTGLATRVGANGKKLSAIIDDMYAYAQRTDNQPMQAVLEDMRNDDVLGEIRSLATELPAEPSTSVGQLEYWADVTDRWAEDLLPAAGGCKCNGACWKRSLPPEMVLEILKILDAEMGLREETRVAQNTKLAVKKDDYVAEAGRLSETQDKVRERTATLLQKLKDYEFAKDFGEEIGKIGNAVDVMAEAKTILERPNTGGEAVAAESEAIEILLAVKRSSENKAGGGSNPGAGGSGDTKATAVALVGEGIAADARPEDTANQQSTGTAGRELPEEFRSGLDSFFDAVEAEEAIN
jgi:hypothetical protein